MEKKKKSVWVSRFLIVVLLLELWLAGNFVLEVCSPRFFTRFCRYFMLKSSIAEALMAGNSSIYGLGQASIQ